jgi:hypothetical protein
LNESQEGPAELVAAGSDTTELLELVEEAFNVVALAIDGFGPAEALLRRIMLGMLAMAPRALM